MNSGGCLREASFGVPASEAEAFNWGYASAIATVQTRSTRAVHEKMRPEGQSSRSGISADAS